MARQINQAGLDLIKSFEGFSADIYKDVAGYPTIGYGHRIKDGEAFVTPMTEEEAEVLLKADLHYAETAVNQYIRTTLNDNQFSALVSLVFNCGTMPLLGTVGRLLNQPVSPDYENTAEAFLLWNHAGGKVIDGLTRRREAEKALFLTAAP